MRAINRPRDDMHMWVGRMHIVHHLRDLLFIVDGDHQKFGFFNTRGVQQIGAGGIAKEHLQAKGTQRFELFGRIIQNRWRISSRPQHTIDHAAETPMTCNDDIAFLVDLIGFFFLLFFIARQDDPFVEDKETGGQQHRQGDDQQEIVGNRSRYDLIGHGEGQEHKAEFTGLCEAQAKEPFVPATQFENPREDQQDRDF